jgi:hypothetical protein
MLVDRAVVGSREVISVQDGSVLDIRGMKIGKWTARLEVERADHEEL